MVAVTIQTFPADLAEFPATTTLYLRLARRVRHVLRQRPGTMHAALRDLNQTVDRLHVPENPSPAPSPMRRPACLPLSRFAPAAQVVHPAAATFAQAVVGALEGPTLRYARRQRLLRHAAALGIPRFEANLVIALVRERRRQAGIDPILDPAEDVATAPHRRGILPVLLVVVLTQAALALAAWRFLA